VQVLQQLSAGVRGVVCGELRSAVVVSWMNQVKMKRGVRALSWHEHVDPGSGSSSSSTAGCASTANSSHCC
jgi:hypothetical protein